MTEFRKMRNQVLAELDLYPNAGDIFIYQFVKNQLCNGDEKKADEFMMSPEANFDDDLVASIKHQIEYRKQYYLRAVNQGQALHHA